MARAFWKGAINFGMVVIPVRMYVAIRKETPRFHYLHKKCLTRPKQVLYCPEDDEYFSAKETVRGYEYARGQYVVLKERDFETVPVKTTHTIDIAGFVESNEIDPIYYYDSHYLEPEDIGVRPYCLFRDALADTKKVGLAKVAFQRREHLCLIRPMDGVLVLQTMHYHYEIRPWKELVPGGQELRPEELKMAKSLINEMATDFKPERYKDEYRIALEKMIRAKVEGEEVVVGEEKKAEKVPDLMSALRESLETARKKSEAEEKARVGAKK
jgi:DNA end-binding protein Ku